MLFYGSFDNLITARLMSRDWCWYLGQEDKTKDLNLRYLHSMGYMCQDWSDNLYSDRIVIVSKSKPTAKKASQMTLQLIYCI